MTVQKKPRRDVLQSEFWQGKNETVVYSLTSTPWGSSPGSITNTIEDITTGLAVDTSSTNLTGATSVNGDAITTKAVTALVVGHTYRMRVRFTCGSSTFEALAIINAEE